MALTVGSANMEALYLLLGKKQGSSSSLNLTGAKTTGNTGDTVTLRRFNQNTVSQIAARKVKDLFGKTNFFANSTAVINSRSSSSGQTSAAVRISTSTSTTTSKIALLADSAIQPVPRPSAQEIEEGIAKAGGYEALSPWLVDGKTKIDVNGVQHVVQIDSAASADTAADPRKAAESALARFGLDSGRLDGDLDTLRLDLRNAAASAKETSPGLSSAIDYALEDAFANLRDLEKAGTGQDAASANPDYDAQLAVNLEQAASIQAQLGLGESSQWALESAAYDLALFGKDMSALNDRSALASEIRTLAAQMQADLQNNYAGSEAGFAEESWKISGALARLTTGLEHSDFAVTAAVRRELSATATVSIGEVTMNAVGVVSMVTVIADPLVFDLNGDGFDLSAAEEGVEFDMDADGVKSQTGFIRGDDALLFLDKDGDGVASDGSELFGNADGYANGFEKLKAYDENGDGVIDKNDSVYTELRLWRELTADGVCETGETMTLEEAGIASIRVDYDNVREDDGKGNLIGQTGSFTREDGSEGTAADVWFRSL